ncbi:MAG TPA: DUF1592 domain-containing protein [Planctomycetaceae bacterium]|nr:DUF1592 domain-containing protein [Planctomycetaceae bacterium]
MNARLRVTVLGLLMANASVSAAEPATELQPAFTQQIQPFLQQFCIRCHNPDELMSGIRVDHLDASFEDRHIKLWEGIRRQVHGGAMPPEDEPQPKPDVRRHFVDWIDAGLKMARSRPTPKNGSARRLTVSQYRNTLRELLLLEDELADVLPPDAVSRDGFVNNQETLALSPLLLETYFEIAEKALDRSLVEVTAKPVIQNFRMDLGTGINSEPCRDNLILGADSLLLNNADFTVTQLTTQKPFAFEPFVMPTKFRFIEGYQGNDTVRGWRDFDSIYHAVFACMRGAHGYPKGRAYSTVPQGLLLRPAIPSEEIFGVESTYGPRANFKISLRELPDHGRFRVTVTAAKYDDGLLLEPGTATANSDQSTTVPEPSATTTVMIPAAGIYQIDAYPGASEDKKPKELMFTLGERQFLGTLNQPAFLVARLPAGALPLKVQLAGNGPLEKLVFTPLTADHTLAKRFAVFETRSPRVGVHLGLRRDCGSTLSPVGVPQTVPDTALQRYVFEGAIRNFPSPDVEKDNVNYLAGIREIGVRSEFTDGRDMPRLLIRSIEFEGPLYDAWPPASHRNLFVDFDRTDDQPAYARVIIRRFATRAFRRPVTAEEEQSLFAVYEKSAASGIDFQNSVKDALLVALTSPQFLFHIENSHGPEAEPLDEFELASKLSYFLWNSPPDEAILSAAAAGTLRQRLNNEVERLIADARFERFVNEFTSQWLALDKFAVLEPSRERFPKLTRDTRTQLRQEPIRFVQHLMRNNLSVRNLIDADFIVANEVTANYYDLADTTENGFDFVAIPHRRDDLGGLLTQSAILAGLSDGRESNPVKRGAWLARRIIADPPDDPPPNVPTVKDDPTLSLRERLERHRNQPGCTNCHAKIDPWGVPFEEFDAGGRWKTQAVDARSTLPDQTEITGFHGLQRYLADERLDQVAFSVLKHLTVYAIGRGLTYNEIEFLKRDSQRLKADGYRLRDMLQYVIQSPMFLEK